LFCFKNILHATVHHFEASSGVYSSNKSRGIINTISLFLE
jgi:hypothetical protein